MNALALPFVCAWCERIRTDPGEWRQAQPEDFSRAKATPGISPECLARETRAAAADREHFSLMADARVELHGRQCSCRGGAWVLLESTQRSPCPGDTDQLEKLVLGLTEWRQLGKPGSLEAFKEVQLRAEGGERREFQRFEVVMRVRICRIPTWRDPSEQAEETVAEVIAVGGALVRSRMALDKGEMVERDRRGAFGGLEALDRVPGVGPGLLTTVAPHVRFGGGPTTSPPADQGLPVVPAPLGAAEPRLLDLNQATREELERLPFVGPYMAEQIVDWRERHGPFSAVDSLLRVPGVGPATLQRVRPLLRVD